MGNLVENLVVHDIIMISKNLLAKIRLEEDMEISSGHLLNEVIVTEVQDIIRNIYSEMQLDQIT